MCVRTHNQTHTMSSCCTPSPMWCAPPVQAKASVLSVPFSSNAGTSIITNTASDGPFQLTDQLVFSIQCESTVTLSFTGSMSFVASSTVYAYPFYVSIFAATAFSQTVPIIDATLSEQTVLGIPGNDSHSTAVTEGLNLNASAVLPAGSYVATLQFTSQIPLPGTAQLFASGTMTATLIKTHA